MFGPQIHLMLNHLPVLGGLFGAAALAVGLRSRNDSLTRFGLVTLVLASVAALPVYFSGAPTEKAVEDLAGVSEKTIERHEDVARVATVALGMLGLVSLIGLLRYRRRSVSRGFSFALLAATLMLSGLMAWTAHLGGEIRHAEIRGGAPATSEAAAPAEAEPVAEASED